MSCIFFLIFGLLLIAVWCMLLCCVAGVARGDGDGDGDTCRVESTDSETNKYVNEWRVVRVYVCMYVCV
ncbi:MAG TPA: hypothetical protein V6C97_00640 [Oculatellaceae cyanobacterium]